MRALAVIAIIFFARIASAQVLISEIKYTGNEWVEVVSNGESTDLSSWKFFEGGTNHKLKSVQGGTMVSSGGYAVIANDATKFLVEYPGFSGILFDSSFSLLDIGESVSIKSSDVNVVDTVSYTGTKGSKNSIQNMSGMWSESTPTPGVANTPAQSTPDASEGSQEAQGALVNNEAVSTTAINNVSHFPVEPQIFTKIAAQTQTVSVGAATTFTGRVWGLKKEPIENARMVWAFGDGASAEGTTVTHTYYYPGEYTVIIDASSGYYAASDRVRIVAVAPLLALRTGGDEMHSFVAIENRGNDELDLSGWQVGAAGKIFSIPNHTLIGAHKTLTLASEVTGLATPAGSTASLHFPNGTQVSIQEEVTPTTFSSSDKIAHMSPAVYSVETKALQQENQEASVIGATQSLMPENSKVDIWVWYVGVAFFAAIALLGFRFTRKTSTPGLLTADDFEITDEDEDKKDDLF